jgi:hypothetical protein
MNKKLIALVLAFTLVFSSVPVAFADTAIPADAQAAKDLGMLKGADGGVTIDYVNTKPTRLQAAVLFLRLKGLEQTALSYTGTANFADANQVQWAEGRNLMAYLNANPELGFEGIGNNKFNPNATIDAASYYKVMLTALGYKQGTDFQWENLIAFAAEKKLTKVANDTNFVVGDVATATIEALKAEIKGGTKTLVASLVEAGVITAEAAQKAGLVADLAVASVKAGSAKSIVVKFNSAVEDTSKVTFTTKRLTTTMTMTTTWNTEKTEATLSSAANLPEANYSVAVAYDSKDLGSNTVAITAQKVGKIEITSTKIAVIATNDANNGKVGYVSYKVYDQYNNDITNSYLANNIKFTTGVDANPVAKNGLLTITSANYLLQFPTIVVVANDTNTGISGTATLAPASSIGTLSDFQLEQKDIKLVATDLTTVHYIPFKALDMSGIETKNYDLVSQGLISLTATHPDVSVRVVKDPANSKNAAIEVKAIGTANVTVDMPVTITAMTYTGKTSNFNTQIVKANEVNSLTLMAPDYNIAVGDTNKVIPFEAYDQSGNKITKFDDLFNGQVTLGSGLTPVKNVDGTARIEITPIGQKGTQILTATVAKTGKMSTLSLNIQDSAYVDALELDTTVFVAAMEDGATQEIDFGYDAEGITVYDQYGRKIDMVDGSGFGTYKVEVTSQNTDLIEVNGAAAAATLLPYDKAPVSLDAVSSKKGSTTVTFKLFNDDMPGANATDNNGVLDAGETVIDTQIASLSVVDSADITGYTVNQVTAPIYAAKNAAGSLTAQDKAYTATLKVYGKTNAGSKVLLAGTPVIGASVENDAEFKMTSTIAAGGAAYDAVKVAAGKLADPAKTSASTVATVNILHNSKATALTTTINSSTVAPKATAVNLVTPSKLDVVGFDFSNDVVTLDETANAAVLADAGFVTGNSLQAYLADGTATTKGEIYFEIIDSYGKKGMNFAQFRIVDTNNANVTINETTGVLTVGALADGDYWTISAITSNGLVKTIKVVYNN